MDILISLKYDEKNNPTKNIKNYISKKNNDNFNLIYNSAIQVSGLKLQNTVFDILQKIVTLKNRFISHGVITEENAEKLNSILEPLLDEIMSHIDEIISFKLYYLSEDGLNYNWKVCNYSNGECTDQEFDKSYVNQDGLYFAFNDVLIPGWPLITCRDGCILFYNRYDKTSQKVFFNGSNQRETYIRVDSTDCAGLFGFDSDLLKTKPLEVVVKVSENQVYYNLPQKDYVDFVGRKNEIDELEKAINHPRHFIVALDGIGGVGKSAIAIQYCYEISSRKHNDSNYFEYIVWLSAKSTLFKGKR